MSALRTRMGFAMAEASSSSGPIGNRTLRVGRPRQPAPATGATFAARHGAARHMSRRVPPWERRLPTITTNAVPDAVAAAPSAPNQRARPVPAVATPAPTGASIPSSDRRRISPEREANPARTRRARKAMSRIGAAAGATLAGREQSGRALGLDHHRGESCRLRLVVRAVEQDGLADTAQTQQEHASGRQEAARPLCGNVDGFDQIIASGELRGRGACSRGEWVVQGAHSPFIPELSDLWRRDNSANFV